MVIVAVASKNPVKLEAVRIVFEKMLGPVDIVPVEPPGSLKKQPIGLKEIVEGCLVRARHAISSVKKAEYGVGIESGLVQVLAASNAWLVATATCICASNNSCSIGLGPGFQLPCKVAKTIVDNGVEMEEAMRIIYGVSKLGEREGAVGLFSKGMITRKDLTARSVEMAFLPMISESEYSGCSEE